jgi:hypothetical protein
MSVRVRWTVTMSDYRPSDDPYTGLPTGPLADVPRTWVMSREFENVSDAQAFIDAAPSTCSHWEIA